MTCVRTLNTWGFDEVCYNLYIPEGLIRVCWTFIHLGLWWGVLDLYIHEVLMRVFLRTVNTWDFDEVFQNCTYLRLWWGLLEMYTSKVFMSFFITVHTWGFDEGVSCGRDIHTQGSSYWYEDNARCTSDKLKRNTNVLRKKLNISARTKFKINKLVC